MNADPLAEKAEDIRPILMGKIDRMDAVTLAVVYRVVLQLEGERLAQKIGAHVEKDAADRVSEALADVRRVIG